MSSTIEATRLNLVVQQLELIMGHNQLLKGAERAFASLAPGMGYKAPL